MKYSVETLVGFGCTFGEAKVVEQVLLGRSNKDIATYLFLSQKTIKFHLTRIFKKFGVKSRTQLMHKFLYKPFEGAQLPQNDSRVV